MVAGLRARGTVEVEVEVGPDAGTESEAETEAGADAEAGSVVQAVVEEEVHVEVEVEAEVKFDEGCSGDCLLPAGATAPWVESAFAVLRVAATRAVVVAAW
jgi:hypothetical protein